MAGRLGWRGANTRGRKREVRAHGSAAVTSYLRNALADDGGIPPPDALDPLPDIAICAVRQPGEQAVSQSDRAAAEWTMRTNYVAPAPPVGAFAERFEERGHTATNVYGSAKAGFTALLSGLRNRLAASGVHAVTVKPGFVRSRMTEGTALPARLTART